MRFHGSVLAAAGLAAIAILAPAAADADESSTVILVGPVDDAFGARMRAELESMGFEVRLQGELAGDPPQGTLAVARIAPGPPRRVEVIVVATDASRRVPSRTAIIEAPTSEDEGVVSVRAAEQLRAFFQPLRPPPAPALPPPVEKVDLAAVPAPPASPEPVRVPSDPPRPAAAREAEATPSTPVGSVGIGLGPGFDVGGVGLAASLSGRVWLHERVVVGALIVAPLVPTTVEGREGSASLRVFVTGLDVGLSLPLADDAWRLHPSLGFAVAAMISSGEARPPFASQEDIGSAAVPFARLELAPRLVGPLRASAQGIVGVAATDLGVRFDGREVATWGRPWGIAQLGLSLDL